MGCPIGFTLDQGGVMALTAQQRKEMREAEEELNAIAAANGIRWSGAEVKPSETEGCDPSERTRYKKPGQGSGRGIVRQVSPKQVTFIKRLMRERDTRNLTRLPGSEDIENMSLKGATDLIDKLLGCPVLQNVGPELMTEKQGSYLRYLANKHDLPINEDAFARLTKIQAAALITELKDKPVPERPASLPSGTASAIESVTEGLYRVGETVYRVKRSREGRLYACEVIPPKVEGEKPEFNYAPGAMREIRPEHRMTLDEVNAYSIEVGFCGICGRTLTRKESIDRGIGPICAAKYGG